jgi:hypothetical protein
LRASITSPDFNFVFLIVKVIIALCLLFVLLPVNVSVKNSEQRARANE